MELVLFIVLRASDYVVIALGFALVFGVGRVLNLSHGAFYLIGAYLAHRVGQLGFSGHVIVVYGIAVVLTVLIGGLFYVLFLRKVARFPNRTMILCLAFNFLITELLRARFGSQGVLIPALLSGSGEVFGVLLARQRILVIPVAVLLLAGTFLVLHHTRAGRALRAVAQDSEAAEVLGLSHTWVLGWTFAVAAGMASVAACLVGPVTVVDPWGWISPLVKSFAVVVLGGSHRLWGVVIAALVLAAAEVAAGAWISEGVAETVSLMVLLGALLIRPKGILIAD